MNCQTSNKQQSEGQNLQTKEITQIYKTPVWRLVTLHYSQSVNSIYLKLLLFVLILNIDGPEVSTE